MNRKGFTLIELLAVIVILGIILTFTVPSITNIYKESKLKTEGMFLNELSKSIDSYVTLNSDITTPYVYAVTGCSGDSADSDEVGTTIEKIKKKQQAGIYTWTQLKGTGASTTGTIYGIYDTSGGLFERNAGRIEDINSDFLNQTGTALIEETANNKSTKYVTVYKKNEENSQSEEEKIASNYNVNNKYGDALKEISNVGVGQTAWNDDWFKYLFSDKAYILHGATYEYGKNAGIMAMACSDGNSFYSNGFRAVLVVK